MSNFPLFPEQASTFARQVDGLYALMVGLTAFFCLLVFSLVAYFAIKYRRRSDDERPRPIHGSLPLELLWSIIPLILAMVVFAIGATVYFNMFRMPPDPLDIYVVGKQWMWKVQHSEGKREINELHVPLGQAVRLTMTSEDVIHDVFIPAFRVKKDVVPGLYTTLWFKATKTGEYHLFCAQYCGTNHSRMVGRVVVMTPEEYESWLAGGVSGESMTDAGSRQFQQLGCSTCHKEDGSGRGPVLRGIAGRPVPLSSGTTVVADDAYLRESLLNPTAKVVTGYQPIMPTFQGQVSEETLMQIIAYIKSLSAAKK